MHSVHGVNDFWRVGRSWEEPKWDASWLPLDVLNTVLMGNAMQYPLPSENVIVPGRAPMIQMGRYWMHASGETNDWQHLIEVYEDAGDDGHVDYTLIGFAKVNDEQLQSFLLAARSCASPWDYPRFDVERFMRPKSGLVPGGSL